MICRVASQHMIYFACVQLVCLRALHPLLPLALLDYSL